MWNLYRSTTYQWKYLNVACSSMKSKSLDITYKYCGELSLLLQGTTYTFGTAQSCNFKKKWKFIKQNYTIKLQQNCASFLIYNTGMPEPRVSGVLLAPPILADQLTLSQPGGHIMPTTLLMPPSPDSYTFLRPWMSLVEKRIKGWNFVYLWMLFATEGT